LRNLGNFIDILFIKSVPPLFAPKPVEAHRNCTYQKFMRGEKITGIFLNSSRVTLRDINWAAKKSDAGDLFSLSDISNSLKFDCTAKNMNS